jgi:hypothetical protein
MPLVLESTAYEIGYAIGQVIGFGLILGIPALVIYGIYRLVKSSNAKAAANSRSPRQPDFALPPDDPDGIRCPDCSIVSPMGRRFCMNCGRQLVSP